MNRWLETELVFDCDEVAAENFRNVHFLSEVQAGNVRVLGPHLVPISAAKGPHFTRNQVPILKNLGPHSIWEQCGYDGLGEE